MKPFLKWPGGKRLLASHIASVLPTKIETYHEPFLGGGAVFFHLAMRNRFKHAVLSDINKELIDTYKAIRDELDLVLEVLHTLAAVYFEEKEKSESAAKNYYLKVREEQYNLFAEEKKAARFLFLNKTCFNGLYRVNKSGKFNVPYGKYKNPKIYDVDHLSSVSAALQGVDIFNYDFSRAVRRVSSGDAVYFDPPYYPIQAGSFVNYWVNSFTAEDHERLAKTFRYLKQKGVMVVESNSDTPEVRRLYKGAKIVEVAQNRSIGGSGKSRKKMNDLIIY